MEKIIHASCLLHWKDDASIWRLREEIKNPFHDLLRFPAKLFVFLNLVGFEFFCSFYLRNTSAINYYLLTILLVNDRPGLIGRFNEFGSSTCHNSHKNGAQIFQK